MEPIAQFTMSETDLFLPVVVWIVAAALLFLIAAAIVSEVVFRRAVRAGRTGSRIRVLRSVIAEENLGSSIGIGAFVLVVVCGFMIPFAGGALNLEAQGEKQSALKMAIAEALSEEGYSLASYKDGTVEAAPEITAQRVSDDRSTTCAVTREAGSREWDSVIATYSIDCIV